MISKKRSFLPAILITGVILFSAENTEAVMEQAAVVSLPGPGIAISQRDSDEYSPDIAYNTAHDEYLVVWENVWANGGHHDIYAQRIAGDGRLQSWFAVSSGSNKQKEPSVAYDPIHDRYLVVFLYDVSGTGTDWDVHGRLIPWEGPSAGLTDFPICSFASNQGHPVAAFAYAQQEFLVAWINFPSGQPSYLSARRIFSDGSGFPSGPFVVSSGLENRDFPDLTYNPIRNEYLLVWDVLKAGTAVDIYGIRLSGTGSVLTGGTPPVAAEFPIAGWPAIEEKPAVATCASYDQYLVAWQSDQSTGNYAIYARHLNGVAALGGVYRIADTAADQLNVDVTCNGGGLRYLLAWQDRYVGGEYGIWGRQVYPSENMDADFEIYGPRSAADRQYPAVAGGGVSYLVAWEHDRDGGTNLDIYGRLLRFAAFLPAVIR